MKLHGLPASFDESLLYAGTSIGTLAPAMLELLSAKAMMLFLLALGLFVRVSLTMRKRDSSFSTPSITILPPKNQWRECSELDWAKSKSSQSDGSRFSSLV